MKVGFIGFGRMGSALANGARAAKILSGKNIIAFDPDAKAQTAIKKSDVRSAKNLFDVLSGTSLIFLCVKPQQMKSVLSEIAEVAPAAALKKICFVSIAAGVTISTLEKGLGGKTPVIRVMPNTPALLNAGVSAMSRGRFASAAHMNAVKKILMSVGKVVLVPESSMDAVTAVSGSGPAYAFYLAEAMISAGAKLGLSAAIARELTHQTIYGAGLMLGSRSESAEELRSQVTSPGGTTAAAIAYFDERAVKAAISAGVERAAARSKELSSL